MPAPRPTLPVCRPIWLAPTLPPVSPADRLVGVLLLGADFALEVHRDEGRTVGVITWRCIAVSRVEAGQG